MEVNNKYSFVRGYGQVQKRHLKVVKAELMKAFDILTETSWRNRRDGGADLSVRQKEAVEEIFAKKGITDVWGSLEEATELETINNTEV